MNESHGAFADLVLIEQARQLLGIYVQAVDSQDLDAIVDLFHSDGVLDIVRTQFSGHDEIRGFYAGTLNGEVDRRHFVTNNSLQVTGPTSIVARSYFWFTFVGDDQPILGWGEYIDHIEVINSQPRFRARRIELAQRFRINATMP